ncbi:phosphate propanoyltransferase [Lysinibacillus macroides]|uniref:Phosphate propanoyltransferase n=1 Tax=Lysinibacillus macroides TaxID=33935 RepID=A0A0M9DGT3_9BACI|nr:phosphate propanoyltransferase [Lysinibacillus macroides]KOY80589.1 acetate kinase [Lysinibacillus macroides]QPR69725.1 phosphate propanoyltransferase [Lysinibacillus macroides]
MNPQIIEQLVNEALAEVLTTNQPTPPSTNAIPIAVSARHIHLKQEHVEHLFGKGAALTVQKMLSQPGQFAAQETLIIVGPKGSITNVRVLGPARALTQVEISHTDAIALGIQPPIRESGNIAGSASCTLVGPKGSLFLQEGVIIAQAHIHMSPQDAQHLAVRDGEYVAIQVPGVRPVTFHQVKIRVAEQYQLEMHIDTDEANAGLIKQGTVGSIFPASQQATSIDSPPTTTVELTQKIITEQDIAQYQETTIIVPQAAIFTALARETIANLGIEIQYKKG